MPSIDGIRFVEEYRQRETHWYVSKIKSYDLDSLRQLREGLRLLDKWFVRFDRIENHDLARISHFLQPKARRVQEIQDVATLFRWNSATELFFAWQLDRKGVISQVNRPPGIRERYDSILRMMDEGKPYRYLKTRFGDKLLNDFAANARNFLSVYKKLGLAWVQTGQTVSLTSTGERFANSVSDEELRAIFERQVLKWQLYNPTLPARYRAQRIFPLVFLLQVLLRLNPTHLSKVEYVLFVTKAQSMSELDTVVEQIKAWRMLPQAQRAQVIEELSQAQPN